MAELSCLFDDCELNPKVERALKSSSEEIINKIKTFLI